MIGRTDFRLVYVDRDLTMPGIEPLIFLGEVRDEDGTHGFVFQDTGSYVQHGSGLEGEEQHDEVVMYFMPESELGALSDVEEIAAEVAEAARRAAALNYPKLQAPIKSVRMRGTDAADPE